MSLLVLLAAAAVRAPEYSFCGLSANSADELARKVYASPDLQEQAGTEKWRVRSNNRDIIWSVGLPEKGGPHAAVCRHVVPRGAGSDIETDIACEGSDAECEKVRDEFVVLTRRALGQ